MLRKLWRERWMLVLAVPGLALGLVYWWLSQGDVAPAEGQPVFYPAVMFYNYTAAPFAILIALVALTMLAVWLPQARRRLPRFALNGGAVLLALAASGLACVGSLPAQLSHYRHVDRAELNGRVYQLGVRLGADAQYFVVCGCEAPGLVCQCERLTELGMPEWTARPELVTAPDGTLQIQIGAETVYSVKP